MNNNTTQQRSPLMDRLVAAGVHLLFSALIVASLVAMVLWVWFPGPLSRVEGVTIPLKILVLVDVILGPLLTFVVFKRGKPSLKKDLAIIITIQLAAFAYGAWVLHQARTAVLAWDSGAVYVVRAGQLEGGPVPDWVEPVEGLGSIGFVYVEPIQDPDFIAAVLRGDQADVAMLPAQYRPAADHLQVIRDNKVDMAALMQEPSVESAWQAFAEDHGISLEEALVVPLLGAHADAAAVLRRSDASLVGLLDLDVRRAQQMRKVREQLQKGNDQSADKAAESSADAA